MYRFGEIKRDGTGQAADIIFTLRLALLFAIDAFRPREKPDAGASFGFWLKSQFTLSRP